MPSVTLTKCRYKCHYKARWMFRKTEERLSGGMMDEIVRAVAKNTISFPVTVKFHRFKDTISISKNREKAREISKIKSQNKGHELIRAPVVRLIPTEHFTIWFNFQDCKK